MHEYQGNLSQEIKNAEAGSQNSWSKCSLTLCNARTALPPSIACEYTHKVT
jgi:hypothetical protein